MQEQEMSDQNKAVVRAKGIEESYGLKKLLTRHKLTEEEYGKIKENLGRSPSFSELGVYSALWSEHCSYKSSKNHLSRFPTTGEHVVMGPGENAGVVHLKEDLCCVFKMESHNHPSFIEPYQGAATGVGGILRDVFCMGARPIALLNCLRFGSKTHPKSSWLFQEVIKGIGDYGNCVGIPTVGGNVSFDDCYNGNILVNAMAVGLIRKNRIFTGKASGEGNLIYYLGSATGRDGVHGATMASDSFSSEDEEERGAIQVGDPFSEKLLLEATLEVLEKNLVTGIQDMGAAGLTSSLFEMAERGGSGLNVNLDKIPVRAENLSAYELLLSESQERMVMVVEPQKKKAVEEIFRKWDLAYAVIGQVTKSEKIKMYHKGKLEVDVSFKDIIKDAPRYNRPMKFKKKKIKSNSFEKNIIEKIREFGIKNFIWKILQSKADKSFIYKQYDRHIGSKTVLSSDNKGAAVMWLGDEVKNHPFLGLVLSSSTMERVCYYDAQIGGEHSVWKAARMISACGGKPLAITDCLNFGNPEDPYVMGDFSQAVDGISQACKDLNTPVVSGNVSLYNETDGVSIHPSPMIGMVGIIDDVRQAKPCVVKEECFLYLLSPKDKIFSFVGSEAQTLCQINQELGLIEPIRADKELQAMKFIRDFSTSESFLACSDIGASGLLSTVIQMLIEQDLSFDIEVPENEKEQYLFSYMPGSYILALKNKNDILLQKLRQNLTHYELKNLGEIRKSVLDYRVNHESIPKQETLTTYRSSLPL